MLVGFAQLIAEANGAANIAHIKEKINEMIIHASLIRAGLEASVYHAEVLPDGSVTPNELFTKAASIPTVVTIRASRRSRTSASSNTSSYVVSQAN